MIIFLSCHHRNNLIRVDKMYLNSMWKIYCNDPEFTAYFPNKFKETVPSKKYFWKIYSIVKKDEYDSLIDEAKFFLIRKKVIVLDKLTLTNEALDVFDYFEANTLNLLGNINS